MPGDTALARSWTFDLPLTKPLSLNDRTHWRARARAIRQVRNATCLLARQARIPALPKGSIELHYALGTAAGATRSTSSPRSSRSRTASSTRASCPTTPPSGSCRRTASSTRPAGVQGASTSSSVR